VTNPPIVIGRRFLFDVLLVLYPFFFSCLFFPSSRSEYLGSCILFGLMRSAIICTQTVGHSPLKKYSMTFSELKLVCLTFVAESLLLEWLCQLLIAHKGRWILSA